MYKSLTWGTGVVFTDQVLHLHVFQKIVCSSCIKIFT